MFLADFIVEADELTKEPIQSPKVTVLQETLIEKIDESAQHHTLSTEYRADILIAKKSTFETKLYTKVIESMGDLTYEVASSLIDFKELISNYSYKVVLFDKEYSDLDVSQIAASIRKLGDSNKLESHVVLVDDSIVKNNQEHIEYVDEIINNVVNRDLLKSLFKKYV
jgi:hypothetical protein